ncbi:unnamed protein product [Rhizophagus irregularis]|nr:unnamed protein product [Rhizophagus irregularis]
MRNNSKFSRTKTCLVDRKDCGNRELGFSSTIAFWGVTPRQKKKFEAKRVNGSVTLPNESLLHLEGSRLPGCYSKDTYHQRFGPGLYFEDDQSPGAKSNLFLPSIIQGHSDQTVLIKTDNTKYVAYINHPRSNNLSRSAELLWKLCLERKTALRVEHIPGLQNVIADQAS